MTSLITLLWCTQVFFAGSASEQPYNVATIPEELLHGSRAVIRTNNQRLVMQPNGEILHERTYAITILDENGEDLANFLGPYDQYRRLKKVSGRIYNSEGEKVKAFRRDDIHDLSMIASFSLYEDTRIKVIDPEYHEYPYTVEYRSTYLMKSFMDLPDWTIYPAYNVSIESSRFEIETGDVPGFRYHTRGIHKEPEVYREGDRRIYLWEMSELPCLISESLTRDFSDLTPRLFISPTAFKYGGIEGSTDSWDSFARWIGALMEGKQSLSEIEQDHILNLIRDIPNPDEKVRRIYRYMQDRVRYVNLKLGAGGFEPLPAERVSDAGYGDCKALSNYMKALLEVAGIRSIYTLVRAGDKHPHIIKDFPSQQFNHVILAVPLESDTIWLECTSQRFPAGYLGAFTDDREVLMVTEEGGVLARTPKFKKEENRMTLYARCILHKDNSAYIEYERTYSGVHFGEVLHRVHGLDSTEQKRAVQKNIHLPGFTLSDYSYQNEVMPEPVIMESAKLSANTLATEQEEYLLLPLNFLSDEISLPARTRNRKFPFYLKRGFTIADTLHFELPDHLNLYEVPDPVHLETIYGSLEITVEMLNERDLKYIRRFTMNEGEYEADRFMEFYRFLRKARAADKLNLLLTQDP